MIPLQSLSRKTNGNFRLEGSDKLDGQKQVEFRGLYDHEIFRKNLEVFGHPPAPFRAPDALPLAELFYLWEKDRKRFQAAVRGKLPSSGEAVEQRERLDVMVAKIEERFKKLEDGELALILVNPGAFLDVQPDQGLLQLYDRIGAGGTPLTGDERLYSIYKHHYPYVRDSVEEIYERIGHVLAPTKIATAALRIAAAQSEEMAVTVPDVGTFTGKLSSDSKFQEHLRRLIPDQPSANAITLATALEQLVSRLTYDSESNSRGIPRLMVTELPFELMHVLIYWKWLHLNAEAGSNLDRSNLEELLRFVLFWHVCVTNHDRVARQCFEALKSANEYARAGFPGFLLYRNLVGQAGDDERLIKYIVGNIAAVALCAPDQMERFGRCTPNPEWRNSKERFDREPKEVADLYRQWWWCDRVLLWIQRRHLSKEFAKNYDPAADREDDKPFDFDHICARDRWMRSISGQESEDIIRAAWDGRYLLGDSVGNFWVIGSLVNRSLGKSSIEEKLNKPNLADAKQDAFETQSEQIWLNAAGGGEGWTRDAREAFQQAVETRTNWLYRRFYEDLDFDKWLKPRLNANGDGMPCHIQPLLWDPGGRTRGR